MSDFGLEASIDLDATIEQSGELAERELPIYHSISFGWGTLRVTEAAHVAYDFVPLVEGVQKGDHSAPGDLVSVRIVGPSEVPDGLSDDAPGIFMHSRKTEGGVGIDFGLTGDRSRNVDQVAEMFKAALAENAGLEEGEQLFSEYSDDESHFMESLEKQLPQMMVHAMCAAVQKGVEETLAATIRSGVDEGMYRTFGRRNVKAFAGAVLLNVVFGPEVATEVLAGGLLGATMWGNQRRLRQYAKLASMREQFAQREAKAKAAEVYADLHRTYCVAHFDQSLEGLFGDTEDESRGHS